ncbi:unnamed protein product [Cyprideis torosa]|uniref:Uncharacterized protein n=1 Tax=Cyprideis torosa TaxID=163714 RepID=A0A7R8W694_9CRUS|nr:unnamed protein product [Cyprideis torosa]CAG0886155.1 unnamed protein product [Cyprideis torosa]
MQAVKAAEKELAEKQKSIAGIEKEVPAATTEKIKVQDDCRKTELALKRVKAEVRKIQGEIDDCRVNPADLQKELKKALAKNSAKEQEIQIHEQDLIKAHQELNDAQEAFNVLEVQAKQGMEKQKKLKADWDALDENVAELEQQKSDILGLMNALRNYGFTSYLINHVECAPAINHLLRKKYQFDTIPVGTAQVDNMTDAIASQTDLFMFYSPTTRYNINSSKYTGKKWTDTNGIRTPTFLGAGGVDENLKSEIEKKIQQFRQREAALRKDIDKLNAQKALLESEMKPLKEIRTRLIRTNNDVQTAKSKIPGCERRVAVAKSSLINIDNLKKQFGTQLQESYDAISRLLEKQVNVMVQQLPELVQKRNLEAAMYRLVLKFEQVKKAAAQEARETLGSFQMKLEQQQQQLGVADEAIQHARNMKKEKRNMARSLSEHDVHEFTEEFSALVGDMEGINRALQDKRQQLNLMDMADQDGVSSATSLEQNASTIRTKHDLFLYSVADGRTAAMDRRQE